MKAKNHQDKPDAPTAVRGGRSIRRDDRGISTPVTHSLSIGITTVMIFGLIFAANGYLEDQQDAGARQQVESIGTELASQLEDAARLGDDSQRATLRVDQPATVMSNTYSVSLEPPGGECPMGSSASVCLEVDVTRGGENLVRGFPVHNDSNIQVSIARLDSSTFTLAATRTGGASTRSSVIPMDQTLTIGIGKGIDARSTGQVLNPFNRPPIAKFTFEPGFPDSSDTMEFNASNSRDPDGTIEAYHWIINGTNISSTGEKYSTSLDMGNNTVTLKVVDDEDGIATTTRTISVSGLEYQDDMPVAPSCMSGKCINASMTNTWGEEIIITDVLIKLPTDINKLKYTGGNEIQVDVGSNLYTWNYDTDEPENDIDHLYSGDILTFDSPAKLGDGEQLRIRLEGVSGGGTTYKNVTIGVRYIRDEISYRTVVTDTGETPTP